MPILAGAVVVLAILVVLNLLLTGAIIRRMRAGYGGSGAEAVQLPELIGLGVGAPVPDFTTVGRDGATFGAGDLRGARTLVGFFSTSCRPCLTEAPEFAERARELAGDGVTVVPVLMTADSGADPDGMAEMLGRAGAVFTEPRRGPVTVAFQTKGTPSYALVGPDGRVAATGGSLDECLYPAGR